MVLEGLGLEVTRVHKANCPASVVGQRFGDRGWPSWSPQPKSDGFRLVPCNVLPKRPNSGSESGIMEPLCGHLWMHKQGKRCGVILSSSVTETRTSGSGEVLTWLIS